MSILATISAITGISFSKKNPHRKLKVLFHEKALQRGQHGVLVVNSLSRGFESERIRFVIAGLIDAPDLTPSLIEHIWSEAVKCGYEPLNLVTYGGKASSANAGVSTKATNVVKSSTRVMPLTPAPKTERVFDSGSAGVLNSSTQAQMQCAQSSSEFFDTLQQQSSGGEGPGIPAFLLRKETVPEAAAV